MELRRRNAGQNGIEDDNPSGKTAKSKILLRKFADTVDLFPKPKEDYHRKQTKWGSAVSWAGFTIISMFILVELISYAEGWDAYHSELQVDLEVSRKVPVHFDITFSNIQCPHLTLDAMDAAGTEAQDMIHYLYKSPVDSNGKILFRGKYNYATLKRETGPDGRILNPWCIPCPTLGSDGKPLPFHIPKKNQFGLVCCNTCQSVMDLYDQHKVVRPHIHEVEQCISEVAYSNPGCNVRATLELRKVHCNFHFAPGTPMHSTPAPKPMGAMGGNRQQQQGVGAARSSGHHTYGGYPHEPAKGELVNPQGTSTGNHHHGFWDISELLTFNISHKIHHFSIGDRAIKRFSKPDGKRGNTPDGKVKFPLKGMNYVAPTGGLAQMNYYLQVVPTVYQNGDIVAHAHTDEFHQHQDVLSGAVHPSDMPTGGIHPHGATTNDPFHTFGGGDNTHEGGNGRHGASASSRSGGAATGDTTNSGETSSFEYSATFQHSEFPMHTGTARMRTSVFFVFDFSPMLLRQVFKRKPFYRFLIKLCPIVGGVFVMMGLVDSLVGTVVKRYQDHQRNQPKQ